MNDFWEWKVWRNNLDSPALPNETSSCEQWMVDYSAPVYLVIGVHVFNASSDSHAAFLDMRSGTTGERPENITLGDEAFYWPQETAYDYYPSFIFVRMNVLVWVESTMNAPSHSSSAYDLTLAYAQLQLDKVDAYLGI